MASVEFICLAHLHKRLSGSQGRPTLGNHPLSRAAIDALISLRALIFPITDEDGLYYSASQSNTNRHYNHRDVKHTPFLYIDEREHEHNVDFSRTLIGKRSH